MEKEKYFIPDIEDLRVGYEFEIVDYASNNYAMDMSTCTWNKIKIKGEDMFSGYKEDSPLETYISYLDKGHIRTSYLTKKQIEKEEWIFTAQIGNTFFFKKKDFELTFNDYYININNFGEYDLGYWGNCKDINTLRYICKLLEI